MLKLVVADQAAATLGAMADGGLLLSVLGGVAYHEAFAAIIAAERELKMPADPILRLGALAVAITEDARRISQRLRLSNAEAKRLDSMGFRWWRLLQGMDEATARRRLYRLGVARYRDRVMLAWSRAGRHADARQWSKLATLPERWTVPQFPLKAADMMKRGIKEGPALGHILTIAEDAWIAGDFMSDASTLQNMADDVVTRFKHNHML
jgi:poly(A) polymerase